MHSGGQAATLDIVEMNGSGWHYSPALNDYQPEGFVLHLHSHSGCVREENPSWACSVDIIVGRHNDPAVSPECRAKQGHAEPQAQGLYRRAEQLRFDEHC